MPEISLPHDWAPRDYQLPAWNAWMGAGLNRLAAATRLALAWHRRAGKDDFTLHGTACKAMQRVGGYWHMLPEAAQARKAIWDAVNPRTGRRRIDDAFPAEIIEDRRESDMFIRFKNGSTWQVVGSDNYNSLVGAPPVGVVFSEYALANPNAWGFLRPILAENGGWGAFISTFRGRNHFQRLVAYAMSAQGQLDGWFGQILSVLDTGIIPQSTIDRERRELIAERGEREAEAIIQQEYYCDPDAALPGTYYADHLRRAELDPSGSRVTRFGFDPMSPVYVGTDLGVRDSTCLWFGQYVAKQPRIIDFIEGSGVGLEWYAKKIRSRPYTYGEKPILLPHDGAARKLSVQVVTVESDLRTLGLRSEVLPQTSVHDRIHATRQFLAKAYINTNPLPIDDETPQDAVDRMQRGIDALRQYRRKWNETLRRFDDTPLHDWASHAADAFGYLAQGLKEPYARGTGRPGRAVTEYNELG